MSRFRMQRGRFALLKLWALASNPGMSGKEADKMAAVELAKETAALRRRQVADPAHAQAAANPLLAKLFAIIARQDDDAAQREPPPRNAPIKGEISGPHHPVVTKQAPPPADPNDPSVLSVWTGRTAATGAQHIPDSEFHGMPDRTTEGWHASIELNERVERERREAWQRRKIELKL